MTQTCEQTVQLGKTVGLESPRELQKMDIDQLNELAANIRSYIVSVVSQNGGHLSSNLGVVELTIALHYCFDFSKDRLVFDVGHQSYVHKLLTGRAPQFPTLRTKGGISGFPKRSESGYDAFNVGHSSTAISAALGMLRAMRLKGDFESRAVALVGDGALTGGLAYEAMDDAGEKELPLIVVLNDNKMSIAGNVGGMSAHLSKLRTSKSYKRFKRTFSGRLKKIPLVGRGISDALERFKNRIKYFVLPNVLFEEIGFTYAGPFDGHNIADLIEIFEHAKHNVKDKPILIHVVTQKGRGYAPAEENPEKFHGVGKFNIDDGATKSGNNNSRVFANELCRIAEKNPKVVAITAAMTSGTGLTVFKERFPDRFFDVGIAEQHGVTRAAGMAAEGLRPVFAVYSTFLQRGYDQLLHDVCLQKLPVVFGIDRAGLVGADGETHQGVYDIAYFSTLPRGIKLFSPSSTNELCAMLDYALTLDGPCAIRYNRGLLPERECCKDVPLDEWEIIQKPRRVTVAATGRLLRNAIDACEGLDVGIMNARLLCPIEDKHIELLQNTRCLITIEDGNADTGFGAQLSRLAAERGTMRVINLGVPNVPIEAASIAEQDEFCGLTVEKLRAVILDAVRATAEA